MLVAPERRDGTGQARSGRDRLGGEGPVEGPRWWVGVRLGGGPQGPDSGDVRALREGPGPRVAPPRRVGRGAGWRGGRSPSTSEVQDGQRVPERVPGPRRSDSRVLAPAVGSRWAGPLGRGVSRASVCRTRAPGARRRTDTHTRKPQGRCSQGRGVRPDRPSLGEGCAGGLRG